MFGHFVEMHYICDVKRTKARKTDILQDEQDELLGLIKSGKFYNAPVVIQFCQSRILP